MPERFGSCLPGCGACCKFVIMQVHPAYLEPDTRSWLEFHGHNIFQQEEGGGAWALIEGDCKYLQPDMTCGVWGKPERPKLCDDFPASQKDIDLVNAVAGKEVCGYGFHE